MQAVAPGPVRAASKPRTTKMIPSSYSAPLNTLKWVFTTQWIAVASFGIYFYLPNCYADWMLAQLPNAPVHSRLIAA